MDEELNKDIDIRDIAVIVEQIHDESLRYFSNFGCKYSSDVVFNDMIANLMLNMKLVLDDPEHLNTRMFAKEQSISALGQFNKINFQRYDTQKGYMLHREEEDARDTKLVKIRTYLEFLDSALTCWAKEYQIDHAFNELYGFLDKDDNLKKFKELVSWCSDITKGQVDIEEVEDFEDFDKLKAALMSNINCYFRSNIQDTIPDISFLEDEEDNSLYIGREPSTSEFIKEYCEVLCDGAKYLSFKQHLEYAQHMIEEMKKNK